MQITSVHKPDTGLRVCDSGHRKRSTVGINRPFILEKIYKLFVDTNETVRYIEAGFLIKRVSVERGALYYLTLHHLSA